jgi:hypothetical protein
MNKIKLFLLSLLLVAPTIHGNPAANEALRNAVRTRNIDEAKTALDNGADINSRSVVQNGLPHYSALMLAAMFRHPAMVSFLISKGADVDQRSMANDESALSIAWSDSFPEIILILLNAGADARNIVSPPSHVLLIPFHTSALFDKDHETATHAQISKNLLALATTNKVKMFLALEEIAQRHSAHPHFQTYSEEFRNGYARFIAQHKKRVTTPRSLREQICTQVKKTLDKEEREHLRQTALNAHPASDATRKEPPTPQDTQTAHSWFDRCCIQ